MLKVHDGVLDLRRCYEVDYNFFSEYRNSSIREIIFPSHSFSLKVNKKGNLSPLGIRKFNVPDQYQDQESIEKFVSKIIGEKKWTLDDVVLADGTLKYSELLSVLKRRDSLYELLSFYHGMNWLLQLKEELTKQLENNRKGNLPYHTEAEQLTVLDYLADALQRNLFWNTKYSYRNSFVEIDKEGNFKVLVEHEGDTYEVKIENSIFFNECSVPLPAQSAYSLEYLFNHLKVVDEILNTALTRMEEDKGELNERVKEEQKKIVEKLVLEQEEKDRQKRVQVVMSDPRVQYALRLKKIYENEGSFATDSLRLQIDSSFLKKNFDIFCDLELLPFFDLHAIDFSKYDLQGRNLANTNIHLNLRKYPYSLRDTNLENVSLLGQELHWEDSEGKLHSIDSSGANFKGTSLFVTPAYDHVEGAQFDETVTFLNPDGTLLSSWQLKSLGINLDKNTHKKCLRFGNSRVYY